MILHIILGLLLLLIPAGALYLLDRQLLRQLGVAVGRMTVQLLVVCLIVWLLMHYDSPWLNLFWLVVMSGVSAVVVLRRARLPMRQYLFPVGSGLLAGSLLVALYLLFVALPVEHGLGARWFVPVVALLLGHSLTMTIRGLSTYTTALHTDEQQYEFLRGNGVRHLQAVQPFLRRALQAVIAPTVSNLSVMGLFTMPLLLCGILLGGVSPVNAFVATLLLTIGCIASSVVSLTVALWLTDRQLFDKLGKLRSGLLVLLVVPNLLSCTENKGGATVGDARQQDVSGFYDSKAGRTTVGGQKQVVQYELPAPLTDRPEQILKRQGYTTSYNNKTKCPNWVAWHLTKAHTYGSVKRDAEQFTEDLAAQGGRATDQDYYNSRYDRGHMCPAGDNKWDVQAMTESFLFTNICPQNHGLNKYEWNDLEILCRSWARKYGAVDIVCGPVYNSTGEQKTIGRNRVWVPDAFFKVILCRQGKPKAIGFIYRNLGQKQAQDDAVCTVDKIELLTGIDFFPALDDKTEARIEAEANLNDW